MNCYLWEQTPGYRSEYGQKAPFLVPYLCKDEEKRGAVIVLPGGGYEMLAEHEGEPYAKMYRKNGFHAFVLHYRVAPYHYPEILWDAQRAIRFVRANAERFHVDPEKIAVCGSSAGGHLALMTAEHFDGGDKTAADSIERQSSRPDALILCYPVVTLGRGTHLPSRYRLLRDCEDRAALIRSLSGERAVRRDMPPVFVWTAANDRCVRPDNSLRLANALQRVKVPYEFHLFSAGHHGVGLAKRFGNIALWAPLSVDFLRLHFGQTEA